MMCPDCSPPSSAPSRCSASSTYRSPTSVVCTPMPCSRISAWKPRFVITVTATVDLLVEREDRDDLIAVDRLAVLVDGEHAITVAVERDAEVEASLAHGALQEREVGCAAADVDVRPVGRVGDRVHDRAAPGECVRRETRICAVRAVDGDAKAVEVAAEPFEDVLEVRVGRDLHVLDASLVDRRRGRQELLDLLLVLVRELVAVRVEELHAVVL